MQHRHQWYGHGHARRYEHVHARYGQPWACP
jgi:hypothetical protein